ncbi:hypothetical protein AOLI_G00116500 [Acnodon oligacanthus]
MEKGFGDMPSSRTSVESVSENEAAETGTVGWKAGQAANFAQTSSTSRIQESLALGSGKEGHEELTGAVSQRAVFCLGLVHAEVNQTAAARASVSSHRRATLVQSRS